MHQAKPAQAPQRQCGEKRQQRRRTAQRMPLMQRLTHRTDAQQPAEPVFKKPCAKQSIQQAEPAQLRGGEHAGERQLASDQS